MIILHMMIILHILNRPSKRRPIQYLILLRIVGLCQAAVYTLSLDKKSILNSADRLSLLKVE